MLRKYFLAATVLSCSLLFPSHTARSTIESKLRTEYGNTEKKEQQREIRNVGKPQETILKIIHHHIEIPPASNEYCQGNYEDFKATKYGIDELLEQFSGHPQQVPYILSDNDRKKVELLWTDLFDIYQALQQNCSVWAKQHKYDTEIKQEVEQLQKKVKEKVRQGYNDLYITTLLAEERYSDARNATLQFIEDALKKKVSIAPLQNIMISLLHAERKSMQNNEDGSFDDILYDVSTELLGYRQEAATSLMYDILLTGHTEYQLAIDLSMEHHLYGQAENLATYAAAINMIPREQLDAIKKIKMNNTKN